MHHANIKTREEYAKPLHGGRLIFAGEGTNTEHPACVDGAYETGARAAREAAAVVKALGTAVGVDGNGGGGGGGRE